MIEEIQKRPFVRPLFLWITGILCYAFLPASSLLYVLGVLSALVFLFLGFSCGRAHAELRYDSRWIWGAIVSVLIVCLAVEVCWYSDRRIALVNEPISSLDLLAIKAQYSLVNTFDRLRLSDEEKSILATLTLGYKKAMSRETKRRFSLAGMSHISGERFSCCRDLWILIFLLLVYAKMGDRTLGSLYHSGGKSLGVCLYHRISALGDTGRLDAVFIFNRKGA